MIKTILLLMMVLMADPTDVYEITWESVKSESQVMDELSEFGVIQIKRLGTASKQKKWSVVIQHKGSKQSVRDALKKLRDVQRVKILDK